MADMKILKPVSKSLIGPQIITKKLSAEICTILKVFGIFDFFQIIEYRIYTGSPIFTIIQTLFG